MGADISLSVSRRCYRPNDAITVTYDMDKATYTKGSCWIGLIPSHITSDDEYVNDNHDVDYFHVFQDRGEATLRTSRAGTYKIKCFANDNGGKKLKHYCVSDIIVGRDRPYISAGATTYKPNENISVSYDLSNCNYSSGSCWIGLIPSHISSTSETTNDQYDVDYFHVSQNTGTCELSTSRVGRYRIKCFANDNGGKLLFSDQDIITVEADDESKIEDEIASIKANPSKSRHDLYELAKKTYKSNGKPVIIDTQNALSDIRRNANSYKNVALPLKLGRDKPFSQWNESEFKREFSRKFNIPIECINILSVRAGSQLIDLKLETHACGKKLIMPIQAIADNISSEKAKKELVEFGIFAMEFGLPEEGYKPTRPRIVMNPQYNREYGPGYTDWDGPLEDGKSRGGEPYFCPKGWKRYALDISDAAYNFDNKYDDWPIAYHGAQYDFAGMITMTGLRCSKDGGGTGCHGAGVYLSPSIKYVSHPRYTCVNYWNNKDHLKKLDLNKETQQKWIREYNNAFSKYDGKYVQCVFMCRVKPGSYSKHGETMGLWDDNKKFDGIPLKEIEWLVPGKANSYIGSDKILIYGIMIRVRDTAQRDYDDY